MTEMLLAGDIGGTKTALRAVTARGVVVAESAFASTAFPALEDVVLAFGKQTGLSFSRACFGVAGPVIDQRVEVTNLPWVVDAAQVAAVCHIGRVLVLNDLEALAWAVPILPATARLTLQAASPMVGGTIAVLASGTGLGTAFCAWDGGSYRAYPAEGGHADFAPTCPLELDMLAFLWQFYPQVSYEWLCSGIGLPNIYRFLRDTGRAEEPDWLAQQLARADDPTPAIVRACEAGCVLALQAAELFGDVLAAAAGNLALKLLATGGVAIGGGMPPRLLPYLSHERLVERFLTRDRQRDLLERMPLFLVTDQRAGLLGAQRAALTL